MLINRTYKTYYQDYPKQCSQSGGSNYSYESTTTTTTTPSIVDRYYVCGELSPNASGEYIYGGFGRPHPESPLWSYIPIPIPDFDYWQLNDTYYLALMVVMGNCIAVIFDFDIEDNMCHEWLSMDCSLIGAYDPISENCPTDGVATVSLTPCN